MFLGLIDLLSAKNSNLQEDNQTVCVVGNQLVAVLFPFFPFCDLLISHRSGLESTV